MKTLYLTIIASLICLSSSKAESEKEAQLQQEIFALKAQLKRAQDTIAKLADDARKGRAIPVRIGQRKALTGSGSVVQIENVSVESLPVKVTLMSPTFQKTNVFDLVLDPAKITGGIKEIGHKEGWTGATGDLILIESQGFDAIRKHL